MFAVCIESSHQRGMGHLFRAINICEYLKSHDESFIILVNSNLPAQKVLEENKIPYETVDFDDTSSNWESKAIQKYGIDVWIQDKFKTKRELFLHIRQNHIILAGIDEESGNDDLLDLHFVGMVFQSSFIPKGKHIYQGENYIVLNESIIKYRKLRRSLGKIIVCMGGSDTYGVTPRILEIMRKKGLHADVIAGPSFLHWKELKSLADKNTHIYHNVSSLIDVMSQYDLAVTGGGVTCFEANAMGIPCIIVANEAEEIDTGLKLEALGGAVFAGYHEQLDEEKFSVAKLDIQKLSQSALDHISLNGMSNIYQKIKEYQQGHRK